MQSKQLILVTGVERSGSTLISRVLQMCDANAGQTNKMRENVSLKALSTRTIKRLNVGYFMPSYYSLNNVKDWDEKVEKALKDQIIPEFMPFMYKDSQIAQLWKLWNKAYPFAKWIIVRRRTGDILNSLHETAYMLRFKSAHNIKRIGASDEKDAWLWWVHQYEDRFRDILEAELNYRIVWPERMRDGNFEQIKEVVDWCDLQWNDEVEDVMKTLLNKK